EARDLPWREAFARFAPLGGVALLAQLAVMRWSPSAALWLLPMALPLLLAVPISVVSSRQRLGLSLRDAGWLMIPEESRVPGVRKRAWHLTHQWGRSGGSLSPA